MDISYNYQEKIATHSGVGIETDRVARAKVTKSDKRRREGIVDFVGWLHTLYKDKDT